MKPVVMARLLTFCLVRFLFIRIIIKSLFLSPLILIFVLDPVGRSLKLRNDKLTGTRPLLVCTDDINLMVENINTVKTNTEAVLFFGKDVDLLLGRAPRIFHGEGWECLTLTLHMIYV
jgi:hypothetical protein